MRQPKTSLGRHAEPTLDGTGATVVDRARHHSNSVIVKAWFPFLLASVLVFVS